MEKNPFHQAKKQAQGSKPQEAFGQVAHWAMGCSKNHPQLRDGRQGTLPHRHNVDVDKTEAINTSQHEQVSKSSSLGTFGSSPHCTRNRAPFTDTTWQRTQTIQDNAKQNKQDKTKNKFSLGGVAFSLAREPSPPPTPG